MTQKDKRDLILLVILTGLIALACCSCRCAKTGVVEVIRTDTVINTETKVEYVPDTVYVNVPAEEKERTTRDSTSHLETSYATSDARINTDGTLYHDLKNKEGERPVEVMKKETTLTRTQRINNRQIKTVTVEKRLSLWKRIAIRLFPWLIVVYVGLLTVLAWTHRKSLLKLVKMVKMVLRLT